ncbi:MAG: phospholipid carrier-dependent glycosyltransferase [Prochloraceae cyanobacterium]|nr:phospholipid carrier-dependent glycosyltransferase [Prochloraceae cyanobacterium]
MIKRKQPEWLIGLLILGIIWLAGAIVDRLWFTIDTSAPPWDRADYLNGAMNYWQALQTPQFFNGEWWRSFWLLSNKIPPLVYILTVPFFNLFGTSADAATLVMLLMSAILLISVYGLGIELFSVRVGLWAALLCQLLPGLYRYRLNFLLDYPLTAAVTFSFWCLTLWKFKIQNSQSKNNNTITPSPALPSSSPQWIWAAIFGLSLGIALMIKQTALFFLFTPLLWIIGGALKNRNWRSLGQLFFALCASIVIFGPWYRTNWLLILTSGKRATIDSAIAEGDPGLNTLDAWTYYGKILPYLLSWPLLLVPIVGILIYLLRKRQFPSDVLLSTKFSSWRWLLVFLVGGYFISSFNVNKDARYILPLLPVLSLFLAAGLLSWAGRYSKHIRWGAVSLALLLMLLNIFPIPGAALAQILSPRVQYYPYLGQRWPHQQVIDEIINTSPNLRSTLGVLPSTDEINQHNFSFYGKLNKFQVVGRQVGVRDKEVKQDARSLDWFITKTGYIGSVPTAHETIVKLVEKDSNFKLQKTWNLPDRSTLKLYHRTPSSIEVSPLSSPQTKVKLERVKIPTTAPPGIPVPVTYQWSGPWEQLSSGIVLITWERENAPFPVSNSFWLHDRAIGMGALHSGNLSKEGFLSTFQVTERTAMLPPDRLISGNYTLKATYLNRSTGETYPIEVPSVNLKIDPAAAATPAPELDLVTQLRIIAPNLSEGIRGLDSIFAQTARINQYDPIQDYLVQTDLALSYRLKYGNERDNLNWAYTIALSRVLRQDVEGAIAAFQKVIKLDSQNPYSYAYLAFVYLYDWQPYPARKALKVALEIDPNIPEIQALNGVAALMGGNAIEAWLILSKTLPEFD